MQEKTIRVGIVGAGANTRLRHIPGLRQQPDVEIVGVSNRTRASSERAAAELGIPRVYDHWLALVEDPDLDAVVIGTWPYLHCPVTLAALEAGKHVLCEARMAMDAGEAHQMLAAARRRPDLIAQLVPSPFTLSADAMIRRLLAEGYLGDVLAIEVFASSGFAHPEAPLSWRQDAGLSGFNVMSLGIWYEALMRWVGEAVRVTALGKTFVPMRRDEDGLLHSVHIPDHLAVLADMACGALANFQISGVAGLAGPDRAVLYGSRGTVRFSEGKLFGGQSGQEEMKEIPVPDELRGHWRVEESFIQAIRGAEPVRLTTFEDGVRYMEFTEAAARSQAAGKAVPLPLDLAL